MDAEGLRHILNSWKAEWEEEWRKSLKAELKEVIVEMKATLAESDEQKRELENQLVVLQAKLFLEQNGTKCTSKCTDREIALQGLGETVRTLRAENAKLMDRIIGSKVEEAERKRESISDVNGEEADPSSSRAAVGTRSTQGDIGANRGEAANQERGSSGAGKRAVRMVRHPGRLQQEEFKNEMEQRRRRKRNIKVRGLGTRSATGDLGRDIKEAIREKTGILPVVRSVLKTKDGVVVEISAMHNKITIMKRNQFIKSGGIDIADDWTPREREVQAWIEQKAEEMRREGQVVRTGYQKIHWQNQWRNWSELEGRLEIQRTRDGRRESNGGPGGGQRFRSERETDRGRR